jgi:alkyl sulfatase BDS1-like metallo-beta-lactamase superfamily hydrolase
VRAAARGDVDVDQRRDASEFTKDVNRKCLQELLSRLDDFDFWFNTVEP